MKLNSLKSLHFIPAHKTNFLERILNEIEEKPDAIVFDLEDSVKPDAKELARENLIKILQDNKTKTGSYTLIIRPNKEDTPYYKQDVKVIKQLNPDVILLAKVEEKGEIKRAKKIYKNKPLIIAIETIRGVENVDTLLSFLNEDDAVVVGYEDLSAELQIERPQDLSTVNPLTHLIFDVYKSARKHNVIIFDAVCRYFKEEDIHILEKECVFTSNLRFTGKFSIHPNQINLINTHFDKKKLQTLANDVVQQFYGVEDGSAVIVKNNQMMDTPSLKLYQKNKDNDGI